MKKVLWIIAAVFGVLVLLGIIGSILSPADEQSGRARQSAPAKASVAPTAKPEPIRLSGRGDSVATCTLGKGKYIVALKHSGSDNFIVHFRDAGDGQFLAANEIGNYSGSSLLSVGDGFLDLAPGSCTVEIDADGTWSIELTKQ